MITTNSYKTLDEAYQFFNEKLFENKLSECLITLQRRKANNLGYFRSQGYTSRTNNNKISEISLNPDTFFERTDQEILSTLVHEMVHAWHTDVEQRKDGKYHDKYWGTKMESIGLIPSNTGVPGGKKTGLQMTHYIDPNGKFLTYASEFLKDNKLEWNGNQPFQKERKERKKLKFKFVCPECNQEAWGKVDTHLLCGECNVEMNIQE